MQPEPRPSKDCEACNDYSKEGYKECYCHCHKIGNVMGYHHHFNSIPGDYPPEVFIHPAKTHHSVWG